jgi:hypothetical protein
VLGAQSSPLRGDAVDRASGAPVPGVEIRVERGAVLLASVRTDEQGRFSTPAIAHGAIVVTARRLGFVLEKREVQLAAGLGPMRLELEAQATELDSVEVIADEAEAVKLHSYRLRRDSKRQGIFMERQHFPRNARYLSEAFRRVPGAQLRSAGIGSGVRLRGCRPAVWVDGIKMDNAEIDDAASIFDVAAIEVYTSLPQAPPQYQDRDSRCGSVLIWLR